MKMKKAIILGALTGTVLTGTITAGAMGNVPVGYLYTKKLWKCTRKAVFLCFPRACL